MARVLVGSRIIFIALFTVLLTPTTVIGNPLNSHSIDFERDYNQYLSISDGDQTGLDLDGNYTFELWVKLESQGKRLPVRQLFSHTLIAKRQPPTERGYSLAIIAETGPGLDAVRFTNSTNGVDLGYADVAWSPSLDTWYHVAVVVNNSANQIELFVDGVSQGTGTGILSSTFNNNAEFRIGHDDDVSYFDGLVDDVRVWNDARTATEIQDNRFNELIGNEPNLVGYWRLNNDLLDETTSANHLTNNNGATFSIDVPFPVYPNRTTWHVSTTGSDETGDGSPGAPFATFQHAINQTTPVDSVIAASGTYTGPGNRDIDFLGKAI